MGEFDLATVAVLTDDDACADCGSGDLDVYEAALPPGNVWAINDEGAIFDTVEGNQIATIEGDGDAWRVERAEAAKGPRYGDCPKCGSGKYRKDLKMCVNCGYGRDKAKKAFNDVPMDLVDPEGDHVVGEVFRCSSCLGTFRHTVADPAEPLPACPNCGSTATSVAGATSTHQAKVAEVAAGVLHTNPGMAYDAAYRLAEETVRRYPRMASGV